jgi:superoxide dismutase
VYEAFPAGGLTRAALDLLRWSEAAIGQIEAMGQGLDLPPAWREELARWLPALHQIHAATRAALDPANPHGKQPATLARLLMDAEHIWLEIHPIFEALLPHVQPLHAPVPGPERVPVPDWWPTPEPPPGGAPWPGNAIPGPQIAGGEFADTHFNQGRRVPIGGHVLPPLPYPYDALEPHIDAATMRLHHDKHHQSYVDGLNKAETMMARARETGDYDLIKHWEREAAFHGAGHYLHTIFWHNMAPNAGGEPTGQLLSQIRQDFGSFDRFKAQFSAAADKVEGSGWALLVWAPRAHRLEILTAEKHQNLSQWDVVPLLVLDVWEHGYYLKYQNNRRAYIDAWWNLVNWPDVSARFKEARRLVWPPA